MRNPSRAFTLIEVIVALAILAIVLTTSMRASGLLVNGQSALRERTLAGFSADNAMALVRLEPQRLGTPLATLDCPEEDLALLCTIRTNATPNPALRRIDVDVTLASAPERNLAHRLAFMTVLK